MTEKVRFEDDQRLDKPDADALQTLVYEYVARAIGGLMGTLRGDGGLLTPYGWTVSGTVVTFTENFMYLESDERTASTDAFGRVVHFDPTHSSQQVDVDASAYLAGLDLPWLWAKRVTVDSDKANRRKWDSVGSSEQAFSPNTRVRERVEMEFGFAAPAANEGWTRIAKIVAWSAGSPAIYPFTIWTETAVADYATGNAEYLIDDHVNLHDTYNGIGGFLKRIEEKLYSHLTAGSSSPGSRGSEWASDPTARGINKLDTDLSSLAGDVAELQLVPLTLACGSATWDGANWTLDEGLNVSSVSGGADNIEINPPSTIAGRTFNMISFSWSSGDGDIAAVQPVIGASNVTTQFRDGSGATVNITNGLSINFTITGVFT